MKTLYFSDIGQLVGNKFILKSELIQTHTWAIPCQRSEKKGQRQKVDFKKINVQDNKAI